MERNLDRISRLTSDTLGYSPERSISTQIRYPSERSTFSLYCSSIPGGSPLFFPSDEQLPPEHDSHPVTAPPL